MQIVQKTNVDLTINQAYLQDCVTREMSRVEEIIDNASEASYKIVISFLSLFTAAYAVMVSIFVGQCCASKKPNVLIFCLVFGTLLVITLLVARMHYSLFKRQRVYRKVLDNLEILYENITINYLEAKNIINGMNVSEYTSLLAVKYSKDFFCQVNKCAICKELLYISLCSALTVATCLFLIFL